MKVRLSREYNWWIIGSVMCLVLLDMLTTAIFLHLGMEESNYIIEFFLSIGNWGFLVWFLLAFVIVIAIYVLFTEKFKLRIHAEVLLVIYGIESLWAVIHNTIIILS